VAGQSKKGNGGSKKSKKDVECWNCHKKGHTKPDCWAPGGGAEGKGLKKWKGKQKEMAAKTEVKDDEDVDAVWMASAEGNVRAWLDEVDDGDFQKWEEQDSAGESWEDNIFSHKTDTDSIPDLISETTSATSTDDISSKSDITKFTFEIDAMTEGLHSYVEPVSKDLPDLVSVLSDSNSDGEDDEGMPDLVSVSDSSTSSNMDEDEDGGIGNDWFEVLVEMVNTAMDCGTEPEMTYSMAILADVGSSPNCEAELNDSGASRHMSPYHHKFINFIKIQPKVITAANGLEFKATGLGDMHIELPNRKSMSQILLKNVLYTPTMGVTLVSISKIAKVGFTTIFHKRLLKILGPRDSLLGSIDIRNGLYRVDHHSCKTATSVSAGTMTIEELHCLLGHFSPEVVKNLVEEGRVEGVKLDKSSTIQSCDSCEYAKAHRKPIQKEQQTPHATSLGEEVHVDVWGPSPVQMLIKHTRLNSRHSVMLASRSYGVIALPYTTPQNIMEYLRGSIGCFSKRCELCYMLVNF